MEDELFLINQILWILIWILISFVHENIRVNFRKEEYFSNGFRHFHLSRTESELATWIIFGFIRFHPLKLKPSHFDNSDLVITEAKYQPCHRGNDVGRARRTNAYGRQQQLLGTQQYIHQCMHGRPPSPSAAQKHILLNFKDVFKEAVRKEGPSMVIFELPWLQWQSRTREPAGLEWWIAPRKCKVSVFVHGHELSSRRNGSRQYREV